MLNRLLGLETEYAIRFTPVNRFDAVPAHRLIYDEIIRAVRLRMDTATPGELDQDCTEFLANGAALSFEHMPYTDGRVGLVEGGTPEHTSPSTVLLYQHAMDRLVTEAAAEAELRLAEIGFAGELRLLKNCRDPDGETYGVQENFEVEFARGPLLWLFRVGWALLIPLVFLWMGFLIASVVALLVVGLVLLPFGWIAKVQIDRRYDDAATEWWANFRRGAGIRFARALDLGVIFVPGQLTTLLIWLCAFRRVRRDAIGFLVSRALITGAGTLDDDELLLGEKAPGIVRACRATVLPADRAVFDTGNLLSDAFSLAGFRLAPMFRLFRRRQRMQLGLADANLCHVAEYLKIGLTALVVDAAEAGALKSVRGPRRPVEALQSWIRDPLARVRLKGGDEVDAYGMQRRYLDVIDEWVRTHDAPSIEARELLRIWREVLDLLEEDPESLVGRLDWVTKRWLLARTGEAKSAAVRKKIDIRYHELGSGYQYELSTAGLCPRLTSDDEVERAMTEPPEGSPAKVRARFIRELRWSGQSFHMGWGEVRVGRGRGAKVIRFADFERPDREA